MKGENEKARKSGGGRGGNGRGEQGTEGEERRKGRASSAFDRYPVGREKKRGNAGTHKKKKHQKDQVFFAKRLAGRRGSNQLPGRGKEINHCRGKGEQGNRRVGGKA